MQTNYSKILLILLCFFASQQIFAQSITGKVIDKSTQQAISGVNVLIEGTYIGTSTDAEGKFKLNAKEQNVLIFSFVGYKNQKITVTANVSDLEIALEESTTFTNEVIVSASRIEEKIMQTPVTVEKISQKTLETSASTEIMNMLARFKGIDVSSSSMLYSAITTRGFNSVKSERMIQLADYMDYASPSLNLYAGNAFGVSDIDLESVDVIYGANSALYGANAFNGVILFHSKDPFKKEGLSLNVRGGSRNLADMSLRFAKKLGNRFAFKMVAGYMEANEFIADNQDAINSPTDVNQAGNVAGYNAINTYGDIGANLTGIGRVHMNGFKEKDLVIKGGKHDAFQLFGSNDYKAGLMKINPSLYFLVNDKTKLIYEYRYAQMNGLYQASSRYGYRATSGDMHRLELRNDRWFVRAYTRGDIPSFNYDLGTIGAYINTSPIANGLPTFANNYMNAYEQIYKLAQGQGASAGTPLTGVYNLQAQPFALPANIPNLTDPTQIHLLAKQLTSNLQLSPDSPEFNRIRELISESKEPVTVNGAKFPLGGGFATNARFWDFSGQYQLPVKFADIILGTSHRRYSLTSSGTLYEDGISSPLKRDGSGEIQYQDVIYNWETGVYGQIQKSLFDDKLKLAFAGRVDSYQNFSSKFSPRISAVYSLGTEKQHNFRVNFARAYRSPTQTDQYIHLDINSRILLGNVKGGFEGQSLDRKSNVQIKSLDLEQVNTWEIGYKGILFKGFYVDLNYYRSSYSDFIGNISFYGREDGKAITDADFLKTDRTRARLIQVSQNIQQNITAQGLQIGVEYFVNKKINFTGNYSWASIEDSGLANGVETLFNTPKHKFNIGANGELIKNLNYNINFRWIDSFRYSTAFATGNIQSYSTIDAQINYRVSEWKTVFKAGGTNLLNSNAVQVYGSAAIGQVLFAGASFDF